MAYCGNHDIHYSGSKCPRCDSEERHRDLLSVTADGLAVTVDAMRTSDYRRANPGEYECPHCRYVALKSDASRCPLCHGEIDHDYWRAARVREQAETERRKIQAEKQRVIDEAAQLERERLAAISQRELEERRTRNRALATAGIVASLIVLGVFIQWLRQLRGFQIAMVLFAILVVVAVIGAISDL